MSAILASSTQQASLNSQHVSVFDESNLSSNVLQKTIDEETGGIFRDTWRWAVTSANSPIRVNDQPYNMNFETALKSEVFYYKKMDKTYDMITK